MWMNLKIIKICFEPEWFIHDIQIGWKFVHFTKSMEFCGNVADECN